MASNTRMVPNASGTAGSDWGSSIFLSRLFEHEPEDYLRRIPGRRESFTIELPEGRRVVKRYRGGAGRDGLLERLLGRPARSAGKREYDNLIELAVEGVLVPRAIAHYENAEARALLRGAGGQSLVVMDFVEHAEDLKQRLHRASGSARRAFLERLALLVRRLHRRGFYHRDLYLEHFLVTKDDELVLIDVARVRRAVSPRRRWLVKDLAALELSAPPNVTRSERLRFLRRYLEPSGARTPDWKRWTRDVVRKARRLGAHAPRFVHEPVERPGGKR